MILIKRERYGLWIQNLLRSIGGMVFIGTSIFFGTDSTFESITVTTVMLGYMVFSLMMLFKSSKTNDLISYNVFGIFLDLILLICISFILYLVMDPAKTPFSFILKSDIYPLSILFIIFHMISFNPKVTLFSGVLFLVFNSSILMLALLCKSAGMTASFSEAFTSYLVNIDFEIGKLIIFIFISMTLYFISRRFRSTIVESAHREASAVQLERYFSPDIAREIMDSNSTILESSSFKQDVAILFSDIEDFTSLSEQYAAEEIIILLSQYHEKMIEAIFSFDGSVDKFVGDSIMATFGILHPSDHDADNAIQAALEMNKALAMLNEERYKRGEFAINHRIGIHYGNVFAGNIGSKKRLEFTVIGDAVNTASRIEQYCKEVKKNILMSKEIVEKSNLNIDFVKIGETLLKGKNNPVELYTISLGIL